MEAAVTCPKCGGEMVQGWVVDTTYGGRVATQWAPGSPKESFWRGTKEPEGPLRTIGAFRCSKCGFLEFYARDEFEPRAT